VTRSDRSATAATRFSTAEPSPGSWLDLAACREVDPEIFFPISTTVAALSQIHEAQAICARCPVAADCLDWALRTGQGHGVWGGTTPEERRALRTIGHRAR
jgi:WhiB family transcriptional regulator, redox-sensing transcriptional regulator